MDAFQVIVEKLQTAGVQFKLYEHEPVYTSEDAARIRSTPLSIGMKALVLYADGKPIMVTVPGDRKVDFKRFKVAYGIKDLRMATPEEVLSVTSVPIGAVPPFGDIFGIPLYMDERARINDRVAFNAGLHTKSISLSEAAYESVTHPVIGDFAK